tara:strand:- start:199 stop:1137 length:939 start_codon:yes stop_codon:yes gene_type:complete
MNRKAIIFGIKGLKLTREEINLLKTHKPWGVILFSRNIKTISQLQKLILSIRLLLRDKKYPILIDEEGGKVNRLNKIINLTIYSQEFFGKLYNRDKELFYKIYINKLCEIFRTLGININTVPVLDVKRTKTHNIIGSRSYSKNSSLVSKLGKICLYHYEKNRIGTVMKHIPGHGMAKSDSHYKTPIVNLGKDILKKKDFKPFKKNKSPFAMTAHVIYSNYDKKYTATHSKIIIDRVIREYINFKGILISDDISMKSLKYSLEKNAIMALSAGCNLILHCNGNIKEMSRLVRVIPKIDNFTKKKTSDFYKFLR